MSASERLNGWNELASKRRRLASIRCIEDLPQIVLPSSPDGYHLPSGVLNGTMLPRPGAGAAALIPDGKNARRTRDVLTADIMDGSLAQIAKPEEALEQNLAAALQELQERVVGDLADSERDAVLDVMSTPAFIEVLAWQRANEILEQNGGGETVTKTTLAVPLETAPPAELGEAMRCAEVLEKEVPEVSTGKDVACGEDGVAIVSSLQSKQSLIGGESEEEEEEVFGAAEDRVVVGLGVAVGGVVGGATPPSALSPVPQRMMGRKSSGPCGKQANATPTLQKRLTSYAKLMVHDGCVSSQIEVLLPSVYIGRCPQEGPGCIDIARFSSKPQRISRRHFLLSVGPLGATMIVPLSHNAFELRMCILF